MNFIPSQRKIFIKSASSLVRVKFQRINRKHKRKTILFALITILKGKIA